MVFVTLVQGEMSIFKVNCRQQWSLTPGKQVSECSKFGVVVRIKSSTLADVTAVLVGSVTI